MSLSVHVFDNAETAAERLGSDLLRNLREGEASLFEPRCIVVPHTHFATWLNLRLAKICGVLANVHMTDLDKTLSETLASGSGEISPPILRPNDLSPLILAQLINPDAMSNSALRPLLEYIGRDNSAETYLKAWQLSSRLAQLYLEYPFQRPEMVRSWLDNRIAPLEWEDMQRYPDLKENVERIQLAEKEIYRKLFSREGVVRTHMPLHRTLPELANESLDTPQDNRPPLYFFCMPIMSIWHMRTIRMISERRDVLLYYVVPRSLDEGTDTPAKRMLMDWGKSQRRAITYFRDEIRFESDNRKITQEHGGVLNRFRSLLNGSDADDLQGIEQDSSLEIWSCPGIMREVENVYERILDLIAMDDGLQLTDIAILTPDMTQYQAPLRIVFSQHPYNIPFNIVDANVAQSSLYAQGLEALLNLLNSSFPRDKVFSLFRNPCFQAAFGIDNEMVDQWLEWANTLGIYHDLITTDRGAADTDDTLPKPMTWEFALQRLRLGVIMVPHNAPPQDGISSHYQNRIPYGDISSQDRETLSKLSKIIALFRIFRIPQSEEADNVGEVEGEAISAPPLKNERSLAEWAEMLHTICETFLKIPFDHPVEEMVRRAVYSSLDRMAGLTPVFADCHKEKVPFFVPYTLIREELDDIPARYGRAVTGGITIASLRRGRLMPFRHIFVLGLGEGQFPGEADRTSIDMRHWVTENSEYDLTIPEFNKGCFLDVLLSAKEGLHLSYVGLSPEDKKEWNPCSLLYQIMKTLSDNILVSPFHIQTVPLTYRSREYIRNVPPDTLSPLPNRNGDQLLLLAKDVALHPENFPASLVEEAMQVVLASEERWREFHLTPKLKYDEKAEDNIITLRHLADFLRNPLTSTLKHVFDIQLYEEDRYEWENESEEPFTSDDDSLRRYQYSLMDWALYHNDEFQMNNQFRQLYEDQWLRCRTPVDAFRSIDERSVLKRLHDELDPLIVKLAAIDANSLIQIVVGEKDHSRSSPSKEITLPSLELAITDTEYIRIHGVVNNILQDSDSVTLLVATPNSVGKSNLPREGLHPLLCYLTLCSMEDTNNRWIKGRNVLIKFLTPKTDYVINCQCEPGEARKYLRELVEDAIGDSREDYLPFEILSKVKIPDKIEESDKEERFMEEYVYQLEIGRNGFSRNSEPNRNSSLLDILNTAPPMYVYAKVCRRFDLLRSMHQRGGKP